MTRGIDSATATAVDQPHVTFLLLLELYFDAATQYLTTAPHSVDWSGNTYLSAQGIGTIEPTVETDTQARGLTFTLAAVNEAAIAAGFEQIQGRAVILRLGIVDAGVLRVDPNVWSGSLDVTTIEDVAGQPVIRVTAEHSMLAWQHPPGQLFSDQDQRAIDPTDAFFEHAAAMAEATIVWPSKEFFKQ